VCVFFERRGRWWRDPNLVSGFVESPLPSPPQKKFALSFSKMQKAISSNCAVSFSVFHNMEF